MAWNLLCAFNALDLKTKILEFWLITLISTNILIRIKMHLLSWCHGRKIPCFQKLLFSHKIGSTFLHNHRDHPIHSIWLHFQIRHFHFGYLHEIHSPTYSLTVKNNWKIRHLKLPKFTTLRIMVILNEWSHKTRSSKNKKGHKKKKKNTSAKLKIWYLFAVDLFHILVNIFDAADILFKVED